jgi:geranylgeranyl pyrophosphate synthase
MNGTTPSGSLFSLENWAGSRVARVQEWLARPMQDAVPGEFGAACLYPLQTGGKRVRPLLALAAAEAVAGTFNDATQAAAVAVEFIHTYSLVHDDLPAMDDDDFRRGKPTVHKAFGEGTAILVGDALLTAAFEVLAGVTDPHLAIALVRELSDAAGHRGMIAGQALDIGMSGPVRDVAGLQDVHRRKTGALIRCAVRMGGLSVGATEQQLVSLTTYGEAVGLAFQLADDILDADEDSGDDGPPSYVRLLGIDETRRRAEQELDWALASLERFQDASALRALAHFIVRRDH